jgi:hypothetical protein
VTKLALERLNKVVWDTDAKLGIPEILRKGSHPGSQDTKSGIYKI